MTVQHFPPCLAQALPPASRGSAPEIATRLAWEWPWPSWATAIALALVVAWIIALYVKEASFVSRAMRALLATLRLLAMGVVLVMLAMPVVERRRVAPPHIVILADRSASMATDDVASSELYDSPGTPGNVSRQQAWQHLLRADEESLLNRLRERYEVQVVEFDDRIDPAATPDETPPAESGRQTRLGDAIEFALRQLNGPQPAAVILLTDGINTAGLSLDEAAARARALGTPLYAVALGSERPRPDVSLEELLVEQVVFPGDRLPVEAVVRASGYAGSAANVSLQEATSGETLAETQVSLPSDGDSLPVSLLFRPTTPGSHRLVLQIDVQEDEVDEDNNRLEFTVNVRDQRIRVLLAASTPSFEYRALKSLLERDPAIELRVRLQDADPGYADVDEAALQEFPLTSQELLKYDVVLLDDVDPALLPSRAWDHLLEFVVEHGGGLVLIAGPNHIPHDFDAIDPMRVLMPIELRASRSDAFDPAIESFQVAPTPHGAQDATFQIGNDAAQSARVWTELPPVNAFPYGFDPKPGATLLAEGRATAGGSGEPIPLILRHYVGAGEVLMHLTDESWRWRRQSDDRYFVRYWGQVVRRLARGRAMRDTATLASDRNTYRPGEPVTLRAHLRPTDGANTQTVAVELEGHSTPTRQIELYRSETQTGLYETVLHDLPPDRYAARLVAPSGSGSGTSIEFAVSSPPDELDQLVVNAEGLAEAARLTGGKFFVAKTAARLPQELPPPQAATLEQLPSLPLWNSPWLLVSLCGLLALEWLLRRRAGML